MNRLPGPASSFEPPDNFLKPDSQIQNELENRNATEIGQCLWGIRLLLAVVDETTMISRLRKSTIAEDVDRDFLCQVENGTRPLSYEQLKIWCNCLGCNTRYFLSYVQTHEECQRRDPEEIRQETLQMLEIMIQKKRAEEN